MNDKKSVCIGFLGNAFNDTRVTNLYDSLTSDGHKVKVISFDWTTPDFKEIVGDIEVYKLDKSESSLKYYFRFMKILYRKLKKTNADIYLAADVYTLPLITIFAKLRKKRLYYDCRELYPFLAGLRNKKYTQLIIRLVERLFIGSAEAVIATGPMDAQFIQHYYKITNTLVLRNMPKLRSVTEKVNLRSKLNIPDESVMLLYQGVIFEGRGIQKTIEALPSIPGVHFVLLGSGNKTNDYKNLAERLNVSDRVHFIGTVPQSELINYTIEADLGLSLIENISLSYYYALPNKMFEYIAAGVPLISSSLPQMKGIVDEYHVGWVIDIETNNLAEKMKTIIERGWDKEEMKSILKSASHELNWDTEFDKVKYQLFA